MWFLNLLYLEYARPPKTSLSFLLPANSEDLVLKTSTPP